MTEITEEQREAWRMLINVGCVVGWPSYHKQAALLAPLLPSELTNPPSATPHQSGTTDA